MKNIIKFSVLILVVVFFTSCASKKPIKSSGAVIIFKTPSMKFYDKGFVKIFEEYINLQIYNSGVVALNLDIYKKEICKGFLQCMQAKEFNKTYLSDTYEDEFLYKLFSSKKIYFKDKVNNVFIKVKKL